MVQGSFNLSDPGPQVYDLSKWEAPAANEFVAASGGNGSWSRGPLGTCRETRAARR